MPFRKNVANELAHRAGMRASNPDCRQLTSGPQDDPARHINVGVAAHITAAAVGGPRYDASMPPEKRDSAENGIWLCQYCAKLIDSDVLRIPSESASGVEARRRECGPTGSRTTHHQP